MDEQYWETRVAAILGTVHDDEDEVEEDEIMLPAVSYETLEVYHAFLMQRLQFPFDAAYNRETGPLRSTEYQIKVYGLEIDADEFYGILCFGKHQWRNVVVPTEELIVSRILTMNLFMITQYGLLIIDKFTSMILKCMRAVSFSINVYGTSDRDMAHLSSTRYLE